MRSVPSVPAVFWRRIVAKSGSRGGGSVMVAGLHLLSSWRGAEPAVLIAVAFMRLTLQSGPILLKQDIRMWVWVLRLMG